MFHKCKLGENQGDSSFADSLQKDSYHISTNRHDKKADDDVVELTERQYRRALGYLIRIEEDEEDIDPMYHRAMTNLRNSSGNPS